MRRSLFVFIAILAAACKNDPDNPEPSFTITSFSPAQGYVGETVVITGENFSNDPAAIKVKVGTGEAFVSTASATSLTITVLAGATTGPITIEINDEEIASAGTFTVLSPQVTSFEPAEAYEGETIVINGTNFNTSAQTYDVKFGNISAVISAVTETSIIVVVPDGAATGPVTVVIDGQSGTSSSSFTVKHHEGMYAYPESGRIGSYIEVGGATFNESTKILFGSAEAQIVHFSETKLKVAVPPGVSGSVPVTIKFNGGSDEVALESFEVVLDRWVAKSPLPGNKRNYGAVFFAIGSRMFYGLGYADEDGVVNKAQYDFWEYLPDNDEWIPKKSFTPIGALQRTLDCSAAFVIDDKAYVLSDSAIWKYDPIGDEWTKRNYFEDEKDRDGAVYFTIGNKGYYGMGVAPGVIGIKDFWEYDPANDTWTPTSSYGGNGRGWSAGFTLGDRGYVAGGWNADGNTIAYEYSQSGDTWTTIQMPFATPTLVWKAGFAVGGFGYYGDSAMGAQRFYKLDYNTATWVQLQSIPGDPELNYWGLKAGDKAFVRTDTDLWEMKID